MNNNIINDYEKLQKYLITVENTGFPLKSSFYLKAEIGNGNVWVEDKEYGIENVFWDNGVGDVVTVREYLRGMKYTY